MPESSWQLCPATLANDSALSAAVLAVHQAILEGELRGDTLLNLTLGIEQRALRRIEDWRVLLLLTPWMLARLLFPDQPPLPSLPAGWSAAERSPAPYQVLGPRLSFRLLDQPQQAHLSYAPCLGHYLLQPICLDMTPYVDAEAVFDAWSRVIRIRDENLERAKRDCPLQREVSRREFFSRTKG